MTIIKKVQDRLIIGTEFTFQALTTVEQKKSGDLHLKFEFINIDLPEIQILGSLFTPGESVNIKSALLEKEKCNISALTITRICLDKKGMFWECLCTKPVVTSYPSVQD